MTATQTSRTYTYGELLTLLMSLGYSRGDAQRMIELADQKNDYATFNDAADREFRITAISGGIAMKYEVSSI